MTVRCLAGIERGERNLTGRVIYLGQAAPPPPLSCHLLHVLRAVRQLVNTYVVGAVRPVAHARTGLAREVGLKPRHTALEVWGLELADDEDMLPRTDRACVLEDRKIDGPGGERPARLTAGGVVRRLGDPPLGLSL